MTVPTALPPPARTREDLGLAILASVLLMFVVGGFALWGALALLLRQAEEARHGRTFALGELEHGDCVEEMRWEVATIYRVVDCADPHAAEFVYAEDFGRVIDRYLGREAMGELATSVCQTTWDYQLHLEPSIREEYPHARLRGVYQGREAWQAGDTAIMCFLYNTDGSPLVGGYYRAD